MGERALGLSGCFLLSCAIPPPTLGGAAAGTVPSVPLLFRERVCTPLCVGQDCALAPRSPPARPAEVTAPLGVMQETRGLELCHPRPLGR